MSCGLISVSITRSIMAGRQHAIGVAVAAVARELRPLSSTRPNAARSASFISSGLVVNRIASLERGAGAHVQVALARSARDSAPRRRRRRSARA